MSAPTSSRSAPSSTDGDGEAGVSGEDAGAARSPPFRRSNPSQHRRRSLVTPPALDYVVTRCLAKDPRQRFQTAFDVLMELQWISSASVYVAAPVQRAARRSARERLVWSALGVVSIAGLALAPSTLARFQPSPEPEEVRFMAPSLPAGHDTGHGLARRPVGDGHGERRRGRSRCRSMP